MEVREGRSPNYVCSLDPLSCVDMEILEALKRAVKVLNKDARWEWMDYYGAPGFQAVKRCKRVRVKGREPKFKQNGRGYTYHGDIVYGLSNAQRFDVYIHDDRRYK